MKTKISIAAALAVAVLFLAGCQSSAAGIPIRNDENATPGISLAEAQKIALEDAGFSEETVTDLHVTQDTDDGATHYDVEFRQGDYEYDYEIDATGKVISRSKEYEPTPTATKPAVTEPPATEPPATEPSATAPTSTKTEITAAKAKSIALRHAGLTEAAVKGLRVESDRDDGVPHYDVEFRKGGYEYSYEIHAETGKIIEWDKDIDD